jgi:hypothetical protein
VEGGIPMMKPKPKPQSRAIDPSPAGRVDVLVERVLDRLMERYVDHHPLAVRLRQVGLDSSAIVRGAVKDKLKRERITGVKSVMKALRRT